MHRLIINKFGPLVGCECQLNNLTILIGPQSSGKSTTSKLFYFFLHIRDEYSRFLLDVSVESEVKSEGENRVQTLLDSFSKRIRRRFIEFWGPGPQDDDLHVKYCYSDDVFIEISSKQGYIDPVFSDSIVQRLQADFRLLQAQEISTADAGNLFNNATIIANEINDSDKLAKLIATSRQLFNFDEDLLFIPAGRSLLSTLSDQLQYIQPHQLDYPMRNFIDRINKTKPFFGKSMADIIAAKQLLGEKNIPLDQTQKIATIIKKILKGEYIHSKDGGKLYIDGGSYTNINFASSGQQESIWILLSLFLVALEQVKALIFIEEPEAHLFPIAQKEMVELIAFLQQTMSTRFIITTHSPYILAALNNHIYANELGNNSDKSKTKAVESIISKDSWLKYDNITGYFVTNGQLNDLCDDELKMLKTELIDTASELVNQEYDRLFEVENHEG